MGKNYLTVVYEMDEKTSVQEILDAHPWALCSHTHAVYELASARLEIESLKAQLKAVSKQNNASWCKDCTPDNCSGCIASGDEPSEQTKDFEEDTSPKKFFTVVYELNEANIDKHIKSLDWVAYIYTNLIPVDAAKLTQQPSTDVKPQHRHCSLEN